MPHLSLLHGTALAECSSLLERWGSGLDVYLHNREIHKHSSGIKTVPNSPFILFMSYSGQLPHGEVIETRWFVRSGRERDQAALG